jgi:hypothetical protein
MAVSMSYPRSDSGTILKGHTHNPKSFHGSISAVHDSRYWVSDICGKVIEVTHSLVGSRSESPTINIRLDKKALLSISLFTSRVVEI